jgi:RNA polymerase sigma-70 factor (ECF subfamily)
VEASAQIRLVRKLKARSPGAFEALVDQFQTPILNMLYRMLGNRAEAEDLAQEVFITVFKQIDAFRGDSSLATWIYRIASNHCINRRKYLARRKHYDNRSLSDLTDRSRPFEGKDGMSGQLHRPDEMAEGLQMERLIQEAISSLDEEHRLVLVLRDIQSLSYEEIEEILSVPAGTVKSRLHRARMALKEKLSPHLR